MSFLQMEIDPAGKVTSHSFSPDITIDRENLVSSDDILSGANLQDNIFVSLTSNDGFNFMALPSYFPNEIYVSNSRGGGGGGVSLTTDFFKLCSSFDQLTINQESVQFFLKKGYCPRGMTFFNEIQRLSNNSVYTFSCGKLSCRNISFTENLPDDDEECYKLFKSTLDTVFDSKGVKRPCVLLSGGADSRLVLLLLRERFDNVQAVTNKQVPTFYENASDVMNAHRIAELTGCTISEACSPYDGVTPDDIDPIIRRMPICAHASTGFIAMFRKASELNVDSVWSGQNMDALYNLGLTNRPALTPLGIGGILRRFFISEEYIATLRDVPGKSSLKVKAISQIGLAMFRHYCRQKNLRLPVSSVEFVHNFRNSSHRVIFSDGEKNFEKGGFSSPLEVKHRLFDSKLEYVRGGDPMVISTCGEINNIPVILPYSDQRMIKYFYNLRLTLKDVFRPKRYVYRYIFEFAGKYGKGINSFGMSKGAVKYRFPESKSMPEAFSEVLSSTSYARFLQEKVGGRIKAVVSYTSKFEAYDRFERLIHAYWLNRVLSILTDEYGVVNINGAQEFLS